MSQLSALPTFQISDILLRLEMRATRRRLWVENLGQIFHLLNPVKFRKRVSETTQSILPIQPRTKRTGILLTGRRSGRLEVRCQKDHSSKIADLPHTAGGLIKVK